jgi:hypothetical protein
VKIRFLTALLAVGVAALTARAAHAQYQFTTIIEDNGGSFRFSGSPASLNDAGQVIFTGGFDDGDGGFVDGVFIGTGGALTTVASANGPLNFFGFATITGQGLPSYFATRDAGGSGFFAGTNGAITLIDDSPPVSGFGGDTMSSTSGAFITYHAFLRNGGQSIFATTGQGRTPIADTDGIFSRLDRDPRVNASGQVAFRATLDAGGEGIFVGSGGAVTPLADASGPFFQFDTSPSINDRGQVVFSAFLDSFQSGIFLAEGGQVRPLLDDGGSFDFLFGSRPVINNRGDVAFLASLDTGEFGLFLGTDPEQGRVLMVGDAFDGSTVSGISAFGNYLNNNGQLAFTVNLADGRTQVVLATPTASAAPEADSRALMFLPLALLHVARRKRATRKN